jgi:hypothetical protein
VPAELIADVQVWRAATQVDPGDLRSTGTAQLGGAARIFQQLEQRDKSGRIKSVARYKVRYRDAAGRPHSETKRRLVDAERRKAEIELDLANGLWRDPQRGQIRLEAWAAEWIKTRHDLRLTTRTRLENHTEGAGVAEVPHHTASQDHQRGGPRLGC